MERWFRIYACYTASFSSYSESSTPNPLNAYGETKLSGEEATRAAAESHVIFRVPILFGEVQQLDESAVTILFKVGILREGGWHFEFL